MKPPLHRISYITAGAAGMYCGSCLHDNTLARALTDLGIDVQLIPTYTPIRTDERNVSIDQVFFGGINVYLQQRVPLFRYLPSFVDRVLDQPWLIRWATSRGISIQPPALGALTVSMLRGSLGFQRKEVQRLCAWLERPPRPQLINFTNMLIAGCAPALRKRLGVPLLVTLQGDDVFLEDLPEPYRSQALGEIRRLVDQIDGFIVFTQFYADFMSDYFSIPRNKFHVVPLGLDIADFPADAHEYRVVDPAAEHPGPRIGYLARLAPEKGLHVLVDAFIQLRGMAGMETARLEIAGWLGEHNREYSERLFERLRDAGLADAFHYHGTIDRHQKLEFLQQIEVLSVPTIYREPKGLFVLEAWAAGVPVVQPDHGAFPEMLRAVGGGRLVRPGDPDHLAETLHELLIDPAERIRLGTAPRLAVQQKFHPPGMAHATLDVFRRFADPPTD